MEENSRRRCARAKTSVELGTAVYRDYSGDGIGDKASAVRQFMQLGFLFWVRLRRTAEFDLWALNVACKGLSAALVFFKESDGVITVVVHDEALLRGDCQKREHVTAG